MKMKPHLKIYNCIEKKKIVLQDEKRLRESNDLESQQVLIPLPLKFTLECTIDGNKKLNIPIFNQLYSLQMNHPRLYYDDDNNNNAVAVDSMEQSKDLLQDTLYEYDDECSGAFLALALALRYKCPIGVTCGAIHAIEELQMELDRKQESSGVPKFLNACMLKENNNQLFVNDNEMDDELGLEKKYNDEEEEEEGEEEDYYYNYEHEMGTIKTPTSPLEADADIIRILPHYKSSSSLTSQSQNVVKNIEHGFQLTKLQSALRIAIERSDQAAAEKIRNEIKKLTDGI